MGGGSKTARNASRTDALMVGLSQLFAVLPGVSRSGTTMSAGLMRGFDRDFAVRFAFLLSIPAVLGANILKIFDVLETGIDPSLLPAYLLGVVSAAVSGYLSIRLVHMITDKGRFGTFAYYCWAMGALTIVLTILK